MKLAILNFAKSPRAHDFARVLVARNFGEDDYAEARGLLAFAVVEAGRSVVEEEALAARLGAMASRIRRLDPVKFRVLILRNIKKAGYEQIAVELSLDGAKQAKILFYEAVAELKGPPPTG